MLKKIILLFGIVFSTDSQGFHPFNPYGMPDHMPMPGNMPGNMMGSQFCDPASNPCPPMTPYCYKKFPGGPKTCHPFPKNKASRHRDKCRRDHDCPPVKPYCYKMEEGIRKCYRHPKACEEKSDCPSENRYCYGENPGGPKYCHKMKNPRKKGILGALLGG